VSRLRGAIVGFGNVAARGHWPGLAESPDLEIVAVVDPSESRRAAARGAAPGLRTYQSVELLAASEALDFVDIATPPSSHVELAAFALERGWHVLCEKPLTLEPTAFARLKASACAAGRVLFTMHNWKVAPIVRTAVDAIRRGRIGTVRHVDVVVFRNQPCKGASDGRTAGDWRQDRAVAGGGILVDHGWHNFYLLLDLVGREPERVACSLTRPADDPAALDDSARVVVDFPGAEACLRLTWRAQARRNAILVVGDEGTLVLDDDRVVVARRGEAPDQTVFPSALSAGSHHDDWFRDLLPHFATEVRDPARRGANLREAGWCVALTAAAYRSAELGGALLDLRPLG
jgi:predicted dehydrogenase